MNIERSRRYSRRRRAVHRAGLRPTDSDGAAGRPQEQAHHGNGPRRRQCSPLCGRHGRGRSSVAEDRHDHGFFQFRRATKTSDGPSRSTTHAYIGPIKTLAYRLQRPWKPVGHSLSRRSADRRANTGGGRRGSRSSHHRASQADRLR